MIVQELLDENTVRTYSNTGFYIYGGFPVGYYVEAIDPINQHRRYVETNIYIITNTESEFEESTLNTNHLHIEEDRLKAAQTHELENDSLI